jgi:DNA repair photolyase
MSDEQLSMFATALGRKGGSATSEEKAASSRANGAMGGRPLSPTLNDDGVSVKGCTIIYAPRGQAGEYAPLATNPYRGCGHKCAYCYVPKVLRMTRPEFDAGAEPRPNFLELLKKDARKYQALGITEQVMMSFTTDPYHPTDNSLTRDVILALQEHGLGVCTLTKGGARALRDIDLFRPTHDAFASTLTSLDNDFSLLWERGAALPQDRIDTLKAFHAAGIFTWVSLEPTLSTEASLQIIQHTHEFVDLYKIGRANYLPMTNTTDWERYTHEILEMVNRLGVKHYIKNDLQSYMPSGYHNPLRVNQYHEVTQ